MAKKKIIILFFSGVILLGVIFIPGYLKIKTLVRQNRDLERQIVEIRQANERLKEEQEKLLNDPIYLEKVARAKLGMVREGEVVYKVVPEQQNR